MTKLKLKIKVIWGWDNIAKCYLVYNKKYNLSGYGKTRKKAKKMLIDSIFDILEYTTPKNKKDDKSRKNSFRKLQKVK